MAEQYDLVVIGAGPGGYVAAIRAAQLGLRTACVEQRRNRALGGTCLNVGCIPSKALLDSSALYAAVRQGLAGHGIQADHVRLDLTAMLARKERIVAELTAGIAFLFKKYGVATYFGRGRLTGGPAVRVEPEDGPPQTLPARHILLATGSTHVELPFLRCDGQRIVSSTEALSFPEVPQHLIVIGGGYIGLELGSVWRRLGARVTVVEMLPRLLPGADGEVSAEVLKLLQRQGLQFHLQTRVVGVTVAGEQVVVQAQGADGSPLRLEGNRVLVAVGRRPYTEGLGLEEAGVRCDAAGRIVVDEDYRTSVPYIYAVGDVIAGPMLAHKASAEGVVCVERLAGMRARVNYETIPSVVYIHPEVAAVGRTEEQLQQEGVPYRVGRFRFQANGRAKALGETAGWVKVLADAATDRVLGVHIVGPQASELIAECASLMEFHASAEDIARCIHPHPSLSEAVAEAARMAWTGQALHS